MRIEAFNKRVFEAPMNRRPRAFDVYSKGEGAPVLIMQELPGIGPETLRLADELVSRGFAVIVPHLFGPLGKVSMAGNALRVFCMRREFHLFAKGRTSPIVEWMRALCADEMARRGVKGLGVIGMCLTGNFAISLMADDAVLAGVASQPSLPLNDREAPHMSADDIAAIRGRLDEHGPMFSYRFEGDPLCRAERFQRLDAAFNGDRERIRLRELPGKGHSVLTLHFVDEAGHPTRTALDEVSAYFDGTLKA